MNPSNPTIQNTILLTFDIEDWFQVENLRPWFPPSTWDNQELRVEKNTHKILDLLDSIELLNTSKSKEPTHPKATFFVLGWLAQRLPKLVREIQNRGHEIASHGFNHLMCNQMNTSEFKEDLSRSKQILEDITGEEVTGYRAPNFSINDLSIQLIQNCGFKYDSSYNDFSKHGRYGYISINGQNNSKTKCYIANNFVELKITNLKIANQTIPWGGGGYFRLFPPLVFNSGVKKIIEKNHTYMFYLHPWEIDPKQPRIKTKSTQTWRHYLNLKKTQTRLYDFITTFNSCNFPTCNQYITQ